MPTKTKAPDRYMELVGAFRLRPIADDEQLDEAIRVIDSLIDRDALEPGEQDYLDVLTDLVERYETDTHPSTPVTGAEMLRHLIDSRDVTHQAVSEATGIAESTLSSVLSGKRELGVRHINALASYFGVAPGLFLP